MDVIRSIARRKMLTLVSAIVLSIFLGPKDAEAAFIEFDILIRSLLSVLHPKCYSSIFMNRSWMICIKPVSRSIIRVAFNFAACLYFGAQPSIS